MEKLIIIYTISILYAFFEMFMNIRQKRKIQTDKKGDRGSLRILTFSIAVGYFLCFSFAFVKSGQITSQSLMFLAGFLLISAGLIIRIISLIQLGRQFTYSVAKVQNHKLIEKGLYKYIRHPGYLGQLIIFTGISILLSNWISVISMIIPVLTGFLYRIHVEEKFMAEQMGVEYADYRKKTKKLIPGIY